ncbi:MAG TPA: hypothetical protein PKX23_01710 [Verrucomicrobiota bacterium]|nr:hypothetical protein [Verrucomicrobiota bacterium]HRT06796.1 hypothetical protein [Candidatus Paceibacterota bacterium]HRT58839.1 hypothetical protein [Candidatus Paceibacterota bacterium]
MKRWMQWSLRAGLAAVVLAPGWASACSICYGEPDSPVSKGLTWAILALVMVVMTVLSGAVAFFVQASRKAALVQAAENAVALVEKS